MLNEGKRIVGKRSPSCSHICIFELCGPCADISMGHDPNCYLRLDDMKERLNKPRVFLSHSKKDVNFIDRIANDLRKCPIEPWLDDYEIRHGQPWLDAIFEDGIPTCDAVLAYLTHHSVTSAVVKKEIDVGILRKLQNNYVAFLPYVSESFLRTELRYDLQVLQMPEWSEANYCEILPRVVAEIWRSFLQRTVTDAIQKERVARLEAELRLKDIEKELAESVCQQGEARDFEYIWHQIDRYEPVVFQHSSVLDNVSTEIAAYTFSVHIGYLILLLSDSRRYEYTSLSIGNLAYEALKSQLPDMEVLSKGDRVSFKSGPDEPVRNFVCEA
ncbi:toll/interleukin-1 receptor domain-containing protein [Methylococcus sp. EFPC2]|uniref:toll/interleukin-1 receptor domain-containing protein n=1 Tax=Methylococcus sp. EFPC2 TaxID=2812648 RepID=UPI001967459E|nr:toll/interleukin-1 receptor domain-containing protein [Methylococcus sp. EFPC2]QSA98514.1 toll/interleukin-1 receptor domain-containing protein [Methylococcus sp. EFPC2]